MRFTLKYDRPCVELLYVIYRGFGFWLVISHTIYLCSEINSGSHEVYTRNMIHFIHTKYAIGLYDSFRAYGIRHMLVLVLQRMLSNGGKPRVHVTVDEKYGHHLRTKKSGHFYENNFLWSFMVLLKNEEFTGRHLFLYF